MLTRRPQRRVIRPPPQPIFDDFKPREEWIQEPSKYILRLYLPQVFKAEDFNVIYDQQSGKITVRGTKQVGENRFSRFESSYNVPIDSNLGNISGILENNILSLTIPKIIAVKPSEKKEEEPALEEKAQIATEEREEEEKLTLPKEKPVTAEEERKEEEVNKEKIEEAKIMNEAIQRIDETINESEMQKKPNELEEKIEEPTLKKKSKIVAEVRKEEEYLNEIKEKPIVQKEKPMTAKEERKESTGLKEMKEEPMKTEMSMEDQPVWEKRQDEADPNETNKEEDKVKEKQDIEEKHETIQKDKLKCFDRENKEDSTKKKETWEDASTRKPRYCHETIVQEKQAKEKESKKRSWLRNEEDKGWLDWLDGAFIDDVLKKVYRNKKFITLALVVFSTSFFISRKLRKRG